MKTRDPTRFALAGLGIAFSVSGLLGVALTPAGPETVLSVIFGASAIILARHTHWCALFGVLSLVFLGLDIGGLVLPCLVWITTQHPEPVKWKWSALAVAASAVFPGAYMLGLIDSFAFWVMSGLVAIVCADTWGRRVRRAGFSLAGPTGYTVAILVPYSINLSAGWALWPGIYGTHWDVVFWNGWLAMWPLSLCMHYQKRTEE